MMRVIVKKWGNSASIRIRASILDAAKLSLDQAVEIREEAGRIIIDPVREQAFSLDDLVAQFTAENLHAEVDSGVPVGKEHL